MSTRSVVYARTESGLKGVYVHYDGYPDGRLPVLAELIRRDGVSAVVVAILGRPSGWSHLSPHQDGELEGGQNDGRFIAVPGYGVQYNHEPVTTTWSDDPVVQGATEYQTPDGVIGDCFIEYVYVIEHDGSVTWAPNDGASWDSLAWSTSTAKAA